MRVMFRSKSIYYMKTANLLHYKFKTSKDLKTIPPMQIYTERGDTTTSRLDKTYLKRNTYLLRCPTPLCSSNRSSCPPVNPKSHCCQFKKN